VVTVSKRLEGKKCMHSADAFAAMPEVGRDAGEWVPASSRATRSTREEEAERDITQMSQGAT
jgi:hypothetical protein